MKKTKFNTKTIVIGALFAALCCVSTMAIQIPTPTNGYVHMGDCLVLLSGYLLGPILGGLSAGIGSALADLLTGYGHYVPGTFVIKFLVAFIAGLVNIILRKVVKKNNIVPLAVSSLAGEAIMVIGYYFYASLLLGKGLVAALSSIPGNIIQGLFGVVTSLLIMLALYKVNVVGRLNDLFFDNNEQ